MNVDPYAIRVLNDKVLVKQLDFTNKLDSGIVLPETSTKFSNVLAEVIAVGDGYRNPDGSRTVLKVSPGDTIVIPPVKSEPFLTKENKEGGYDKFFVLGESSILAVTN